MVQRRGSLGFALKTIERLSVVGGFIRRELQRDMAAKLEILSVVNHTHATAADPADDAVVRDRLSHGLGGRGHWLAMLGMWRGGVNGTYPL